VSCAAVKVYFTIMAIEYAEQTNGCKAARYYPNVETTKLELKPILCENYHLYRFKETMK
jgi:hypothetical protein